MEANNWRARTPAWCQSILLPAQGRNQDLRVNLLPKKLVSPEFGVAGVAVNQTCPVSKHTLRPFYWLCCCTLTFSEAHNHREMLPVGS